MQRLTADTLYNDNMAILKKRFAGVHRLLAKDCVGSLRMFHNRSGQPNAMGTGVDGRQVAFYEDEDIRKGVVESMSGWQLGLHDIVFFIGLGLGYHPLQAVEKFAAKPHLVIIEPNLEIFQLAMRTMDLRPLLDYERLDLYVGECIDPAAIIENYNFQIFLGRQRVVTHAASRAMGGASFANLENEIKARIGLARDLWQTNRQLGPRMIRNTMENLPSLCFGQTLGALIGRLKGLPAICVASGPSLDRELQNLKQVGDRCLVVAIDSAVSSLLAAGIKPHMVVTVDVREENFDKLRPFVHHLRDCILIYALESNPDNVRTFPGQRRIAVSIGNPILDDWLGPELQLDTRLPTTTTVSQAALFSLAALGVDPIVLVGMDLAFPSDASHARHAVHHYNLNPAEMLTTEGVCGLPVATYRPMIDYRLQIENVLKERSVTVINTGMDGAYISGTIIKTLEEVMATTLPDRGNVAAKLAEMDWKPRISAVEMTAAFDRISEKCVAFSRVCRQGEAMAAELEGVVAADPDEKEVAERYNRLQRHRDKIESEHSLIARIIECSRLDEIRVLAQRREKLSVGRGLRPQREMRLEEAAIYNAYFRSQRKALVQWFGCLSQMDNYFWKINELACGPIDGANNSVQQLDLARAHMGHHQLWLAEKHYWKYLAVVSPAPEAWRELIAGYHHFQLWRPASELLQRALKQYPQNRRLLALHEQNKRSISAVLAKAKAAWHEARKHLVEYMSINAEDPVAQKMSRSLNCPASDDRQPQLPPNKAAGGSEEAERLLAKAQDFVKHGEPERVAGILEGLAKRFPGQSGYYREKLGDFRYLQQQFSSAAWHYAQAGRNNPMAGELAQKAAKALEMAKLQGGGNPQWKEKDEQRTRQARTD